MNHLDNQRRTRPAAGIKTQAKKIGDIFYRFCRVDYCGFGSYGADFEPGNAGCIGHH